MQGRLGIDENDLCVGMDGLDVFAVAPVKKLHKAYHEFFAGGPDGIMFAGDTKCE
jgi:hypothetical protein